MIIKKKKVLNLIAKTKAQLFFSISKRFIVSDCLEEYVLCKFFFFLSWKFNCVEFFFSLPIEICICNVSPWSQHIILNYWKWIVLWWWLFFLACLHSHNRWISNEIQIHSHISWRCFDLKCHIRICNFTSMAGGGGGGSSKLHFAFLVWQPVHNSQRHFKWQWWLKTVKQQFKTCNFAHRTCQLPCT